MTQGDFATRRPHVAHPVRLLPEHGHEIALAPDVGHHEREADVPTRAPARHLEGDEVIRTDPDARRARPCTGRGRAPPGWDARRGRTISSNSSPSSSTRLPVQGTCTVQVRATCTVYNRQEWLENAETRLTPAGHPDAPGGGRGGALARRFGGSRGGYDPEVGQGVWRDAHGALLALPQQGRAAGGRGREDLRGDRPVGGCVRDVAGAAKGAVGFDARGVARPSLRRDPPLDPHRLLRRRPSHDRGRARHTRGAGVSRRQRRRRSPVTRSAPSPTSSAGSPGWSPGKKQKSSIDARRRARLFLELLPPERYPRLVESATPLSEGVDPDAYFSFGLDLLLAGIEAMAARRR